MWKRYGLEKEDAKRLRSLLLQLLPPSVTAEAAGLEGDPGGATRQTAKHRDEVAVAGATRRLEKGQKEEEEEAESRDGGAPEDFPSHPKHLAPYHAFLTEEDL